MKVRELIRLLCNEDPDDDVMLQVEYDCSDNITKVDGVQPWLHFQTNKPMGAIIITGSQPA